MGDTSMTDASAIAKAKAKAAEEVKARNDTVAGDGSEGTAAVTATDAASTEGNGKQDAPDQSDADATTDASARSEAAASPTAESTAESEAKIDPMVEAKRKELMAERAQARAAILKEATEQVALVQQNKARALDKAEEDFKGN